MSFLSIIAFVVLLAVLMYLTVVKNRASAELHAKLHPPQKQQEEFLKACELYLEYCGNLEDHSEPEADAKYDAALAVRAEGYLPMAWEQLPVRSNGKFAKKVDHRKFLRDEGQPVYMTYDAIRNIRRNTFLECRKQDQSLSGFSQDPRFWNEGTFRGEAWKDYCDEMDAAFNRLLERFVRETDDGTEKGPRMDG